MTVVAHLKSKRTLASSQTSSISDPYLFATADFNSTLNDVLQHFEGPHSQNSRSMMC
jgi:hypothetical protein